MHPQTEQHAFTPILHRPASTLPTPVPMGAQDRYLNMHPPRKNQSSYFAPINAFHRRTHKSFRSSSNTHGKWAALHVRIAWRIYYHKKLKKMHQIPKDQLLECPTPRLPDLQQCSCSHPSLASPCGISAHGNAVYGNETGQIDTNKTENRSKPFQLYPSSPASCDSRATLKEELNFGKLDQSVKLLWKTKHLYSQTGIKDLPSTERSWDTNIIPELNGRRCSSLGRKRQLEHDGFIEVKRVKRETEDNQWDFSTTLHSHPSSINAPDANPFSHTQQNMNTPCLCDSYPSKCMIYPETKFGPYQNASWKHAWSNTVDPHFRQKVLKDFHGIITPPLYFPFAPRWQEVLYPSGREALPSVLSPLQMAATSSSPFGNILLGTWSLQSLPDKQRRADTPITATIRS